MNPLSLFEDFDSGVEKAKAWYEARQAGTTPVAFGKEFAAFTFYDIKAATSPAPNLWKCLDARQREEPRLWQHIHRPLAQILREDKVIGKMYAGFATLFTVDWSLGNDRPQYPSMAIDVPFSAKGFRNLELSRLQFSDDPSKPLVLTDICLNKTGDPAFKPKPIIFHWRPMPNDGHPDSDWGKSPETLISWSHVFVTTDIPPDDKTGLPLNPDWDQVHCQVHVDSSIDGSLTQSQFLHRLRKAAGATAGAMTQPDDVRRLENRFAWTIAYFAYGCGKFLNKTLDRLAIVCVPASFAGRVSSALYVPLYCDPRSSEFSAAVDKILHLARAVGMPLSNIHDLSITRREAEIEGIDLVIDAMSHELSKQTTALFSNRLRRLSDIFVVNDLPRTNDRLDFNDWPESAGSVSVDTPFEDQVANWLVCPVPELLAEIRSFLIIWAGSPGSLAQVGGQTDAVREFVKAAAELGIRGRLAEMLMAYSPASLEMCRAVLNKAAKERSQLSPVVIKFTGIEVKLVRPDSMDNPKHQNLPIRLFRAVAAAVSNAVKHSSAIGDITLTVCADQKRLAFIIRNHRRDPASAHPYHDGTRQVIESCLRGIMANMDDIRYGPDPNDETYWITGFEYPRQVMYRDDMVKTYTVSNET